MTATEQLKRIASVKPPPLVRIYRLDRGQDWWTWLCPRHLAAKLVVGGYTVKESKDPPHELPCDDRALFKCGREMRP